MTLVAAFLCGVVVGAIAAGIGFFTFVIKAGADWREGG